MRLNSPEPDLANISIIEIKYAYEKEQAESGDPNRPKCPERLSQEPGGEHAEVQPEGAEEPYGDAAVIS